jgi:hypothetical protein
MPDKPIKRDPLQMAVDEATQHGASKDYLASLRTEFDKANKANKQIEPEQIEISIPS